MQTNFIKPRDVADKSVPGNLHKAIAMALDVESKAVKKNTSSFNKNRYKAKALIPDYELLKDEVRAIKEKSIDVLPVLLHKLEESVKKNGGTFYLARTAGDAAKYITNICSEHNARLVVKAKSITSEEIKLNRYLENKGIEVAETDLAEFILQISDEQPSHIVAPAIHRSRERISQLFKEKFDTSLPLETGEDLTKFARDILRDKFLSADVGISGANVIASDGTLLLVESEGNIRMVTQAPPVHIAVAGIEKVIPERKDLWKFLELLAPSATGQNLTSYTHIIKPPLKIPSFSFDGKEKKPREFHLVLVDNGRMKMRNDKILREALYCIRCSACMNVCANFQVVGGHAFGGETYPGGIGGSWEAGTGNIKKAEFSELCSGCSRCTTECPVKIDIPWLNENLRSRLNKINEHNALPFIFKGFFGNKDEEGNISLQKLFFANYNIVAKWGSRFSSFVNTFTSLNITGTVTEKLLQIDKRRKLPGFTSKTLTKHLQNFRNTNPVKEKKTAENILLFIDSFTNYARPEAGIATIKIFEKLKPHITISKVGNEGRDALSQGLINTAKKRATETVEYLRYYLDNNYDIIVIEPSVLSLFRNDYKHFIEKNIFEKLKERCFEPLEYLYRITKNNKALLKENFNIKEIKKHPKIFYHSHCQQRTIGASQPTEMLLKELGFEIETSSVECCGMAGSFGYKKQYYDLSVKVGEELIEQINQSKKEKEKIVTLTSGVSCHHQINDLSNISTIHPVQLIAEYLK